MTLHALAKRCDDIAAANGFDRPSWDNLIIKLALVGTELDEARDAVLGTGEDPLEEELADVAIRLLSILYALWEYDWIDRSPVKRLSTTFQPIEVLLWPTLKFCLTAVERYRYVKTRGDGAETDVRTSCELALAETFRLAATLKIDLLQHIDKKCVKNEGRAKLHGKASTL